MTAIAYRAINVAHLGRRHVAHCRLCHLDIGHFALRTDAEAEGEIHLRRRHEGARP